MSANSFLYLLGTRIDNLSKNDIIQTINSLLREDKFHQIATVNPEFLLEAQKNKKFKDVLNNSDLNVADGIGIKFAVWRYGKHLKTRYTGIDLMWDILKIANKNNLSIFIAASAQGLSDWQDVASAIKKQYPRLVVMGDNISTNTQVTSAIKNTIVFVNFGAPFQEIYIQNIKKDTATPVRLAMGVGGAFDYITGNVPRAPIFLRKIGMEWLYRLIQQPTRLSRIYKAVVLFPLIILFTKNHRQN